MLNIHSRLTKIAAVVFAVPLIAIAAWYAVSFLPYLGDLKNLAQRGQESMSGVETTLYPLAIAAETKKGIRFWAIRQAYVSQVLKFGKRPSGTLARHLNQGLWYVASYIHLTDREVFSVWVECSFYSCRHGLPGAAQKYFGRELKNLSETELASLVATVKNPTMFAPGTERGKLRATEILEKIASDIGYAK